MCSTESDRHEPFELAAGLRRGVAAPLDPHDTASIDTHHEFGGYSTGLNFEVSL